jgi:hypothetical protein
LSWVIAHLRGRADHYVSAANEAHEDEGLQYSGTLMSTPNYWRHFGALQRRAASK